MQPVLMYGDNREQACLPKMGLDIPDRYFLPLSSLSSVFVAESFAALPPISYGPLIVLQVDPNCMLYIGIVFVPICANMRTVHVMNNLICSTLKSQCTDLARQI